MDEEDRVDDGPVAMQVWQSQGEGSISSNRTHMTFYTTNNELAVKVYMDGQVEFGPGYSPSKAAKAFWQAVRWYAPEREQGE